MERSVTDSSLPYASAIELLELLREGRLGSRELLEAYVARIEAVNPKLNAVVATDLEAARKRADEADQARKRGESWGPLHGLPMTLKDTWEMPGMPCTGGNPELASHRPEAAAPAVQRLLDAGAIVFAKTNVPYKAMDIQSYNDVYGTTNNPWSLDRTPGGSSGGSAASLAAGFTPIELGSDIGGSIRIPAHFCGVYGHKATYGIIPLRGHVAAEVGHVSEPVLAVAGPMARTAEDLRLVFELLVGPHAALSPGWKLELPAPRHDRLERFRVLLWIDDPDCPIDSRMAATYGELARALEAAGVQVDRGAPGGMGLRDLYPAYIAQMGSVMKAWMTPSDLRRNGMVTPFGRATAPFMRAMGRVADLPFALDHFVAGMTKGVGGWLDLQEEGLRLRETFSAVFGRYDVILAPPTITTAIRHDHSTMAFRRMPVDGKQRHYADQFMWISPATLLGLPATSAPVGLTADGAPVNVQILGAPYEDRTTIEFARLVAGVAGGFRKPPLSD